MATENEKTELQTWDVLPTEDEQPIEYVSMGDMQKLTTATIKFRGVMVHADCRIYEESVFVMVHMKQNGKMYASAANAPELDIFVTRHTLTMWLHKKINTLEMQEVNADDKRLG